MVGSSSNASPFLQLVDFPSTQVGIFGEALAFLN